MVHEQQLQVSPGEPSSVGTTVDINQTTLPAGALGRERWKELLEGIV